MAGTITQEYYNLGHIKKVIFDCTADAAAATFPATALTQKIEGFLLAIETNPGATAPTDNYDITLVDAEGLDKLNSAGLNRDTADTEIASIALGTYFHPIVSLADTLTLTIANNAVNSAITRITLYYGLLAD